MRLFNKVAIIGLGLIGGSIALGLKKKRLAKEVVGVSLHRKTLFLAKKRHAIDRGSQSLEIINAADLVILATPINTMLNLAGKILKIIPQDTIVTDVGSTKAQLVSKLEKIFTLYIGSHPLAGSEKRGIANAEADIFESSLCILTPTKNTEAKVLLKINQFWRSLGCRIVTLTPDKHDKILSLVSHLPHAVAFSLINAIAPQYLKFASTGLSDTTRIAASDEMLWSDIFLTNRENMLKAIGSMEKNLSAIKSVIKNKNQKLLNRLIKEARKTREALG